MRISVIYKGRWYGTAHDTADFRVSVQPITGYDISLWRDLGSKHLGVRFEFVRPMAGRGVGEKRGTVSGAYLVLSESQARRLATTLLWQLERPRSKRPLKLRFKANA